MPAQKVSEHNKIQDSSTRRRSLTLLLLRFKHKKQLAESTESTRSRIRTGSSHLLGRLL
jgi:hypothetical protein